MIFMLNDTTKLGPMVKNVGSEQSSKTMVIFRHIYFLIYIVSNDWTIFEIWSYEIANQEMSSHTTSNNEISNYEGWNYEISDYEVMTNDIYAEWYNKIGTNGEKCW